MKRNEHLLKTIPLLTAVQYLKLILPFTVHNNTNVHYLVMCTVELMQFLDSLAVNDFQVIPGA